MRHRNRKKILDRNQTARASLYRHLATSLILHGRIQTTEAKAKSLRPFVERLITLGRVSSLAHRRQLLRRLRNTPAVERILTDLSPKYKQRPGGYTRITKSGRRLGDAARLAIIEFV